MIKLVFLLFFGDNTIFFVRGAMFWVARYFQKVVMATSCVSSFLKIFDFSHFFFNSFFLHLFLYNYFFTSFLQQPFSTSFPQRFPPLLVPYSLFPHWFHSQAFIQHVFSPTIYWITAFFAPHTFSCLIPFPKNNLLPCIISHDVLHVCTYNVLFSTSPEGPWN